MQKPFKSQAVSVLALVALAVLGYFAAEAISGMVDVRLKKSNQPADKLRFPSKVNWVSPHQASVSALDEGKPIVCFFTRHESKDCRRMEQELLADNKVVEFINKNFIPVIVIVNDALPENAPEKLVQKNYGITDVPTVIVTDPDGRLLEQQRGYNSLDESFKFLSAHAKVHQIEKFAPIGAAPSKSATSQGGASQPTGTGALQAGSVPTGTGAPQSGSVPTGTGAVPTH